MQMLPALKLTNRLILKASDCRRDLFQKNLHFTESTKKNANEQ